MKHVASLLLTGVWLIGAAAAQPVPPPEKLLPADTLGVLTVPDMAATRRLLDQSPQWQLWRDPALAPFVNKFWAKLETDVLQPIEKELGASLTNYLELAQGQFTLALTRNGWPARAGAMPGLIVLIDSREQSARVKTLLEEGRAKLAAGGEPVRTQRIDGTEFLVLTVPPPALEPPTDGDAAVEADEAEAPAVDDAGDADPAGASGLPPQEFYVGQSGTLLLMGNSLLDLEKVLKLKSGGAVMALSDSTSFLPDFTATLSGATLYGWLNLEPIFEIARQELPGAEAGMPMGLSPARILSALGLNGLKTLSIAGAIRGDGGSSELRLRIPEAERRGLFRMFSFAAKDSAPPAFVPADVLTFSRTRIDLLKSWNTLESMLVEVSPQIGGMVKLTVDAIGKDKDPGFDFRRQFIANLGDDIISWQGQTKPGTEAATLPPQLALISSPKPEELAGALKLLMGMVPPDLAKLEESEVGGKKVWSMAIPMGQPGTGGVAAPSQSIAFAGADGFLAVAADPELLKSHLTGSPAAGAGLLSKPGFRVAAERVGGLETGMFGYSNDRESMRSFWGALTTPGGGASNPTALAFQQMIAASAMVGDGGGLAEWIDFSLLPAFDEVQKYFHFTVYAAALNKEGLAVKVFAPKPPGL